METVKMERSNREISHGRFLAAHDPEWIWGWNTPAGRVRAERRARLIAEGARLGPDVRCLEIGCGTGLFTERFAATGAHIVAVDISSELLEIARRRGLHPERVEFLQKPFEACDVDGPFDAVIGSSILHHLDMPSAVEKIRDLLKPGGVMSFAEPNMLNPQIFLQKNIPWLKARLGDSPDETAFVREPLQRLIRCAGFDSVTIIPFDWLHPRTPTQLIAHVRWIGRRLERIPGIRELAGSLYIKAIRAVPSELAG